MHFRTPTQEHTLKDMQCAIQIVKVSMNDAGAISGCQSAYFQEAEEEKLQAAHRTQTGGTFSSSHALVTSCLQVRHNLTCKMLLASY